MPAPSAFVVLGTDTEIGKTRVTSYLAQYFDDHYDKVTTQKWVETGAEGYSQDLKRHDQYRRRAWHPPENLVLHRSPYLFSLAASPHLAAEQEGRVIQSEVILHASRSLMSCADLLIVEGAGGVMVPYSENGLMLEWVEALSLPVVIVAADRLGTINHTLLTLEACRSRHISVLGVILNACKPGESETLRQDHPQTIAAFGAVNVLGQISFEKEGRDTLSSNHRQQVDVIGKSLHQALLRNPCA